MPASVVFVDTGGPVELIRGATTTLAPVLRGEDAAVITPTSWTAALYRNEAVVASGSGTGAVSWALAVSSTATLASDYQIRWTIHYASGRVDQRQDAIVCRWGLYPSLTPADIYARAPALNPSAADPLRVFGVGQSINTVAISAWQDVLAELRNRIGRPHLITSGVDLRGVHLARTLELVYLSAASTTGEAVYMDLSLRARDEYRDLWPRLTLRTAPDDQTDGADVRAAASLPMLGGAWDDAATRYPGEPRSYGRGVW
jgi:hypothetical protein